MVSHSVYLLMTVVLLLNYVMTFRTTQHLKNASVSKYHPIHDKYIDFEDNQTLICTKTNFCLLSLVFDLHFNVVLMLTLTPIVCLQKESEDDTVTSKKVRELSVIDGRRAQNCNILLSK